MTEINITIGDAVKWANEYDGELFHAIFCDAPYHLTSIVKRFGKENSAPAKNKNGKDGLFQRASKGFMGQVWDGGDVAFRPETWHAFSKVLHDGAFGMTFGGSRGWHRLAVAIEDAGFIIHPTIFGWAYGSGFPKATRVKADGFEGYRYGLQALKPAVEPIIVFQKPYKGRPVDCISETGAGVLNIDGTRIRNEGGGTKCNNRDDFGNCLGHNNAGKSTSGQIVNAKIKPIKINRYNDGGKSFGGAKVQGEGYESVYENNGRWASNLILMDESAAQALDNQSGHSVSRISSYNFQSGNNDNQVNIINNIKSGVHYEDEGGASRFFFTVSEQIDESDPIYYCAKTTTAEKSKGMINFDEKEIGHSLSDKCLNCGKFIKSTNGCKCGENQIRENNASVNPHPTVKPIELNRYLSTLLLPPTQYAPRRIFLPFAGVASEMIGAMQAGWEIVQGVEITPEYIPVAEARIEYWRNRGWQNELI